MKKRVISIIATLALLVSSVPTNAMAASVGKSVSNSVTNVKTHITLLGTYYITYNFNGMNVDSRNAGASWNRFAFEHMSDSDKRKVSGWYLPGGDRTEQFGKSGEQVIIKYINDSSGWSHAWKVMKDKIGKKYLKDLRQYYGGGEDAEDDTNSYYNKEIDRLTTFDKGTAAYEVLYNYPNYPESEELFAMYGSIPEMMKVGKDAYDACVDAYYQDIAAGTKAVSTFTLNFITDNCMVPGTFAAPSATLSGVRTAGYTLVLTAKGFIRDSVNRITGYSYSYPDEMLREAIAGGSGTSPEDAIKVMKTQEKIIEENYKLAKYCHEQCEIFKKTIESKARDVLKEIENNQTQYDKERARLRQEAAERSADVTPDISDITLDYTYYEYIVNAEPTADPEEKPELYKEQLEEWYSTISACEAALSNEFDAWKKNCTPELEEVLLSMGYDVVIGDDLPEVEITFGTNYYDIDTGYCGKELDWMRHSWETCGIGSVSDSQYPDYGWDLDDEEMQSLEDDAKAAIADYENAILIRDGFISRLESLAKKHEREYESLYAKAKGIRAAGRRLNEKIDISKYDNVWEKVISRDVGAANTLYGHKDSIYLNNSVHDEHVPAGRDYYRVMIDNINKCLKRLKESRAEHKKEMEATLDNYIELQSLDDSLISEYNKLVKERNELLDSAPDYVKEQKLYNYNFNNINDYEIYTPNPKNEKLRSMIDEATKNTEDYSDYQKAKNAFFKKEADKLETMYEKLRNLDRRLSYIKDTEESVNRAMDAVRGNPALSNTALSEEKLNSYGINDHKGLHIGAAEELDLSWDTENYDKEKRAMKLLLSDFRGTGNLQMQFMQTYDNYKAKRSAGLYAVSLGEMTHDNFKEQIYGSLYGAYIDITGSSSNPTYAGPFINIGEDSEIDLQTMYDDEDCEVQKTFEIAQNPESYVFVEGISPDGVNTAKLNEGSSIQLSATVSPANATSTKVIWESLSPKIAGVDENGLVTAYNEGEAVIRAVAADAPLTEIKDTHGNVTGYETPDKFVTEFTINVIPVISYDSENGKIIINSDKSYENAELLIAEYSSDGMLISVSPYTISIEAQEQYEKPYTANENYTKIMLWNSLDKMKPLAAYLDDFEYNDEY